MSNEVKSVLVSCVSSLRLVLAIAILVIAVAPAQSMSPGNATIVPILPLLLDEEPVDPTLPVANAGPDAEVLINELVQLDGSGSTEPTNLPLTYLWSFTSQPAGSTAALNDETLVNPEFVLDLPGEYVLQLVVNNGIQDSLPDSVTIRNTNRAPIADAGENAIVPLNQAVQLDGSGSDDIDGDPVSYSWSFSTKPALSAADFNDATIVAPEFTPDVKGNYVIDLVVNDGIVDSVVDQIEILAGAELSIAVADVFFGVGRETTATISIDPPAPPQGVVISLSVDDPFIGLSQSQITFAAGETEQTVTLTGLEVGTTNLNAVGTNIEQVSAAIEVSGALISVDEIPPLSPSAAASLAISLSQNAPVGGVTVDLEVLDTGIATVSPTSLFIPAGQSVPTQNAQVTGVGLGETALRATGPGFAPDERDIQVALAAEFDPGTLEVPETLTREIVLTLDAPAPTGGVTFALAIVGDALFSVQNSVTIDEGQTQSQPITLTGLTEGVTTLRASAANFVDADAQITVVDAPNVYLAVNGSSAHLTEAVIGIGLQNSFRVRLQAAPTSAVDIRLSVPENSGVLLSDNSLLEGSHELVLEDVLSTITNSITFQGLSLGDDVPLTIEAVLANTNDPAGYEALTSTVDVDPSGVYVSTSDTTITTFSTNTTIAARTVLLHDDESTGPIGALRQSQSVRAGGALQVPMQVDNVNLLTLPDGATGDLTIAANSSVGTISISPANSGVATVSIVNQPAGFSLPSDRDDNAVITINAPEAFLLRPSSSSHYVEALVGLDLQRDVRVRLETAPPAPVDVQISVPVNSGVALSSDRFSAGGTQLLIEDVTNIQTLPFYLQGLALGDDVPITIEVFQANTTTPAGYNELASTVDVDPSGIYVSTSDYSTTTFSNNRPITVQSVLLFDTETPTSVGQRAATQAIRGGIDLTVPMQVDDIAVTGFDGGTNNGANIDLVISGGSSSSSVSAEPIGAGQATISIASLPGAFAVPSNFDDEVVATVSAPNAFLRPLSSNSHQVEATVGIDLQSSQYIGLAVTPPAPVDIAVSVPPASGVLIATDATAAGTTNILFEAVSSIRSPIFYVQGIAIGDDVPINIEVYAAGTTTPIGYNSLNSTIDVDPSGVYMLTADFTTNTFAANSTLRVNSALLHDDEQGTQNGQRRFDQPVRGGLTLMVPLTIDDDSVAVLPAGASDSLSISAGQQQGLIELDPLTSGVATVDITAQPNANFTLPSNRDGEVVVTVTAPDARFNISAADVGDELQTPVLVSLETAPPNPVTVTVEVSAPAAALVSGDPTMAGSATVTFNNVVSTSVGVIYVQGLTLNAATEIKVSAPGYNDATANIQIVDSGFRLNGNFSNIDPGLTRNFTVRSARLNANGGFASEQQVRGGASFNVPVSSSLPSVGTVTSPVTLNGGSSNATTTFTAVAPGTTTIEVTQPGGFTPPVGQTDADITVN